MTSDDSMEWIKGIFIWVVAIATIVGYILNIFQLFNNDYNQMDTITKVVGVFIVPLGAILGFVG
jgi:hypothetical protein